MGRSPSARRGGSAPPPNDNDDDAEFALAALRAVGVAVADTDFVPRALLEDDGAARGDDGGAASATTGPLALAPLSPLTVRGVVGALEVRNDVPHQDLVS